MTFSINVPRKTILQSQQDAGIAATNWVSSADAVIVLTGQASGFSLQAEIYSDFGVAFVPGSVNNIPGPWQPVGAPMTASGSYTLAGVRSGPLRLNLKSGDASGVIANIANNV